MAFWIWNKISNNNIAYYNKAGPFDLIHAHYLLPDGYLAYLYSRKFSLPYVITIRNADILFLKGLSKKNPDFKKASLVINKAQQILVLNLAYKIFIDDLFGISSLIIPHGIEKNAYFNDSPHAQSNKIIITTVSEAIKRKNIDWIINGFMNYSGNKSIELNIIGTGPLIDQLKKLSKNDNRVIFHGKTDRFNVLKILKYSDIFALPSFSETFGLVYLEAAATKNAIIGLKNEGVWGIFDNETEMLFCNNESHFQELFHKLINNHNLVSTLKTNAFKKALLLDWDNIVIKYKDVYNKAIDSFNANTTN
jgi:glycosyltransferase involved in cell wall biosynthesis